MLCLQMFFSELCILYHHNNGLKPYTIVKLLLEEEGIYVSKVGVWKFLKVYKNTGSTMRRIRENVEDHTVFL